jgi:hypothetical protein
MTRAWLVVGLFIAAVGIWTFDFWVLASCLI